MDRKIIEEMVEDFWRAMIPAMQDQNLELCAELGSNFEKRISDAAEQLSPIEKAAFLQAVETARERIISEYQHDPVSLKMRLGLNLGVDGPTSKSQSNRMGLGELVARTAVRATVWDTINSLFRLFR